MLELEILEGMALTRAQIAADRVSENAFRAVAQACRMSDDIPDCLAALQTARDEGTTLPWRSAFSWAIVELQRIAIYRSPLGDFPDD